MGRTEQKRVVQTRVSARTYREIERLATAGGESVAGWLRRIIMTQVLEKEKPPAPARDEAYWEQRREDAVRYAIRVGPDE